MPPEPWALTSLAVRRVWPEVLAAAKERKKRTAALLVARTDSQGDTAARDSIAFFDPFVTQLPGWSFTSETPTYTGDTVILESDVVYTRKDGREVTIKTVSILQRDGELVERLAFYNDPTLLFA